MNELALAAARKKITTTMNELIFYPNRAGLVEGLKGLREDSTVVAIDVVHPGTTLRVTRIEGYPTGETLSTAESHTEEPEESESHTEESEDEIDLENASRDELRQIVTDYALDVEIPAKGPLKSVREAVAAALDSEN